MTMGLEETTERRKQMMSVTLSRVDSTYPLRVNNLYVFLGLSFTLLVKSVVSHTYYGFNDC